MGGRDFIVANAQELAGYDSAAKNVTQNVHKFPNFGIRRPVSRNHCTIKNAEHLGQSQNNDPIKQNTRN